MTPHSWIADWVCSSQIDALTTSTPIPPFFALQQHKSADASASPALQWCEYSTCYGKWLEFRFQARGTRVSLARAGIWCDHTGCFALFILLDRVWNVSWSDCCWFCGPEQQCWASRLACPQLSLPTATHILPDDGLYHILSHRITWRDITYMTSHQKTSHQKTSHHITSHHITSHHITGPCIHNSMCARQWCKPIRSVARVQRRTSTVQCRCVVLLPMTITCHSVKRMHFIVAALFWRINSFVQHRCVANLREGVGEKRQWQASSKVLRPVSIHGPS